MRKQRYQLSYLFLLAMCMSYFETVLIVVRDGGALDNFFRDFLQHKKKHIVHMGLRFRGHHLEQGQCPLNRGRVGVCF